MSPPTVVTFSTSWGSAHGGINVFNTEICLALAKLGCTCVCATENASDADLANARANGVILIPTAPHSKDTLVISLDRLEQGLAKHKLKPDLYIGHDIISGGPALLAREALNSSAPCALFHHMHYLSYKGIEGRSEEAAKKNQQQQELFTQASVILAVGPKLLRTAQDMVRHLHPNAPPIHEIVPGVPQIVALPAPSQFRLFFAGRLSDKSSRLKQTRLAVAAFGQAVANFGDHLLGPDPTLTLLGVDEDPGATAQIEQLAWDYAGRHTNIIQVPYTTDRNQLLHSLREHSAAMLLSLHEGFGLTAWEAIGAGVPLIISQNSGVYEFLQNKLGGTGIGCIYPVNIKASNLIETPSTGDITQIVDSIARIAKQPERARQNARSLLSQLGTYTWLNTARHTLEACGIPTPSVTTGSENKPKATATSNQRIHLGPLFDIYDPSCVDYYIARPVDAHLDTVKHLENIWIWGSSGTGKTTSLRHHLMQKGSYIYVGFEGCIGASAAEIFTHLLDEISSHFNIPASSHQVLPINVAISKITKLLTQHSTSPTTIHLDEIPTDKPDTHSIFCKAMGALLLAQATATPTLAVTYAISTFDSPLPYFGAIHAKISGRLSTIELPSWSAAELESLIQVARKEVPVAVSSQQQAVIISKAKGSPRFVKNCLKRIVTLSGTPGWTFERIVRETELDVIP